MLSRCRVAAGLVALAIVALQVGPAEAAGLTRVPYWISQGNQDNARHGWSARAAGDVNGDGYADLVVGAYLYAAPYDDSQTVVPGRVQVFHGGPDGPGGAPATTLHGDITNVLHKPPLFGHSVSTAGDVNGDGYDDIIVGAPQAYIGYEEGAAYVYYGSAAGIRPEGRTRLEGEDQLSDFGFDVAAAGDVNADGYGDVIIGAPFHTVGSMWEGAAFVYLGSAAGIDPSTKWKVEANMPYGGAGWAVDGAGDVNGDGYDDVIIGLYSSATTSNGLNQGRVWVFHGGASGLQPGHVGGVPNRDWEAKSTQEDGFFGHDVSAAGDVDNDGYDDVLIGAYRQDNPQLDEGRVHLYLGSPTGLGFSPARVIESNQGSTSVGSEALGAQMGWAVGPAGDIDRDGYDDVLISVYRFDSDALNMTDDEGQVRVYTGTSSGYGVDALHPWAVESNQPGALFADSVGFLGDVNGDGFGDVLLGTMLYDMDQVDEGVAFVYMGVCGTTDADGDGLAPASDPECAGQLLVDCDDSSGTSWALPRGVAGLAVTHDRAAGTTTLLWEEPMVSGTSEALGYDVIRASSPSDFLSGAVCVESGDLDRTATDAEAPAPGGLLYYLIRPLNGCPGGQGSLGRATGGLERVARDCP